MIFFNDTATTEIYTLSLHDALPICQRRRHVLVGGDQHRRLRGHEVEEGAEAVQRQQLRDVGALLLLDRKSTRLNSSHANISYAVFCLKKKNLRNQTFIQIMFCAI